MTYFDSRDTQNTFFMRGCASSAPASADPSIPASGPAGPTYQPYWDTDASFGDWYGAHELVLKDVAGKTRTYDPVAGGDRPFPLVASDALLAASGNILLAAVGQDIWIMSGTGGLPTGLQSPSTDVHIWPIDNSRFFVRISTGAYVVAMPQKASRDPSWCLPHQRHTRRAGGSSVERGHPDPMGLGLYATRRLWRSVARRPASV